MKSILYILTDSQEICCTTVLVRNFSGSKFHPNSCNSKCCPNCRDYQILPSFYALICLTFLVVFFCVTENDS